MSRREGRSCLSRHSELPDCGIAGYGERYNKRNRQNSIFRRGGQSGLAQRALIKGIIRSGLFASRLGSNSFSAPHLRTRADPLRFWYSVNFISRTMRSTQRERQRMREGERRFGSLSENGSPIERNRRFLHKR